ncbi:hypothetical protein N333_02508, partial [Nestor notabilis]
LARAKSRQMTWSVSLSALTTQKDCLASQKHRNRELNDSLFDSFLALEAETSTNQKCFHNGTLASSSLYRIFKVVLKRKLIEKTSGIEREENAECRFLMSEIKSLEVYKGIGAQKTLNKLLFLGCLLHALMGILYQYRQNHSKAEKKRHAVTVYKVRRSSENCIITATRKQNRKIHYLLRTHGREVGVQVIIQHPKRETEGTKSSRRPDAEIKLHKA